jgi:putative PIN family toxin of toxin-antitoxin system
MITAILDTSVIVSYFCTQKSIHTDILLKKARDKIIILCTSRLLYQELQLAIQYGRVKKALQGNQNRISQFMVWYKYNAVLGAERKNRDLS